MMELNELDCIARMLCTIQAELIEQNRCNALISERINCYNKDFLDSMEKYEKLRGRRG